jgi:mono/diheme cytochrome c family protein
MISPKHGMACALFLASVSALAVSAQQSSGTPTPPARPAVPAKRVTENQGDGQRIFQQHCSRCHTAPEGFSPRISGTIVRHMRVRASLSEREEKELLRFFNP